MKNAFAPRTARLVALGLLGAALSGPALAQTPAVGFDPGTFGIEDNAKNTGAASYSLGFEFTANSAAFVTSLGFFSDPSFNPDFPSNSVTLNPTPTGTRTLADSHAVGLYQIAGGISTLLASATVTSAGMRVGDFQYQSLITPVLLTPGGDYVLAAVTGATDPYVYAIQGGQTGGTGLVTNGITYVQERYAVSSTLVLPTRTESIATPGYFGPNFLTAAVPEASTTVGLGLMLALSLAGMGLSARRRTSSSR